MTVTGLAPSVRSVTPASSRLFERMPALRRLVSSYGDERDAILDAVHKRARPIVMTTIAMTAGMVPSALGRGEGQGPGGTGHGASHSNRAMCSPNRPLGRSSSTSTIKP